MDGSVFISLSEPEPDSDSDAEHKAKCANPLAYTAPKEEPVKSQKVKLPLKPSILILSRQTNSLKFTVI
jgi:hypothetical protein